MTFERVDLSDDVTLYRGNNLAALPTLPDNSVHCCVTSPPYLGLRSYGIGAENGEIGLEATPAEYVAKLVAVFREVWRVLRADGTCWINLGDSYAADRSYQIDGTKQTPGSQPANGAKVPLGLKPKDLLMIPARVAIALQEDGWYLRSEIVWAKGCSGEYRGGSVMPESVTDRATKSHEMVYMLTKSARYWSDFEAIKEASVDLAGSAKRYNAPFFSSDKHTSGGYSADGATHTAGMKEFDGTRNRRDVWVCNPGNYSGAHFATFPPALITPMILAGCPAQCCPICGKGWERVVEKTAATSTKCPKTDSLYQAQGGDGKKRTGTIGMSGGGRIDGYTTTLDFRPSCTCGASYSVPGIVLDPFGGSGTTAEVAVKHGRRAILIDLNADYVELQKERLRDIVAQPRLFQPDAPPQPQPEQVALW